MSDRFSGFSRPSWATEFREHQLLWLIAAVIGLCLAVVRIEGSGSQSTTILFFAVAAVLGVAAEVYIDRRSRARSEGGIALGDVIKGNVNIVLPPIFEGLATASLVAITINTNRIVRPDAPPQVVAMYVVYPLC